MANTLIKLYDEEVELEEYILVDEEDVERVKEILEIYRKTDPKYDIYSFLEGLEANGIEYEAPPVEKVYF